MAMVEWSTVMNEKRLLHGDEAFEREAAGARAGLNPMFGEWSRAFPFAPVTYGAGADRRAKFREDVRAAITTQFLYTHDVQLEITLFLDLQTVLETDQTADLDNYAKALLDALKGQQGILLDDTQVQAMTISWIDNNGIEDTRFEVRARSSPDDFMVKPVEFYEMSDGLYYPYARRVASLGGKETGLRDQYAILRILDEMVRHTRAFRHVLRRDGAERLSAFRDSLYMAPIARGFHRSRIDDFTIHSRRDWLTASDEWIQANPEEGNFIQEGVEQLRAAHDEFVRR